MSEHPIEGLMRTAMSSIQNMVDVNTIIGDPIETGNNKIIIPKKDRKTRAIRFFLQVFHCFPGEILQSGPLRWPDGSVPSDYCRNTDCA